ASVQIDPASKQRSAFRNIQFSSCLPGPPPLFLECAQPAVHELVRLELDVDELIQLALDPADLATDLAPDLAESGVDLCFKSGADELGVPPLFDERGINLVESAIDLRESLIHLLEPLIHRR